MRVSFENKSLIFYIVSATILVSLLSILYFHTVKIQDLHIFANNKYENITLVDNIESNYLKIEKEIGLYISSAKSDLPEALSIEKSGINNEIEALLAGNSENKIQNQRINQLRTNLVQRMNLVNKIAQLRKSNVNTSVEEKILISIGLDATKNNTNLLHEIKNEELRLLQLSKIEIVDTTTITKIIFTLLVIFIVTLWVLLFLNITIQKKRNKELEIVTKQQKISSKYSLSLIEASRDFLVTIDPLGKITDTNEASVNLTGIERNKLIGSDFFEYFTESEKAREVYRIVYAQGSVADSPLTLRHKNGKLTEVLFNGSVYKDEDGNDLGVVIVARDITAQKTIENELIEAKVFAELATIIAEDAKIKAEKATQIAEDAVKAKQQFLSNMSHEIRTPMNAIIGFTKVVLKTDLNTKQKEYLNAIKLSGDALIVLINDILDLAKVDAGKMVFEKNPFKLERSISAMLHLFETKIQEKNIVLIKNFDPAIPLVLLGDSIRLHQIILNLISNAVKFTNEGTITLTTQLQKEDDESVTIEFIISDTGIGILPDKLEYIFENFQQASSSTSRIFGGTGLGLAIVKQLVESQGGNVSVVSEQNVGSSFSFTLHFSKTNKTEISESEISDLNSELKNIKVLVVEDMVLNQLLMKTLLDDFGFERDIAANGKIAIEKIVQNTYDVVLMDLQMPEMNGFEATQYIREVLKSDIPIIALTADVTTVDLEKCTSVGMNDYITKPVDERVLYSKIISFVKTKRKGLPIKNNMVENEVVLKPSCINLEYLNDRTKADPTLMMEMISIYLEQTPPLLDLMHLSYKNEDWKSLDSALHKMIPSFYIMGISKEFEKMAKQIQEYAVSHQSAEKIPKLLLQINTVCSQACDELTKELNRIKNNN